MCIILYNTYSESAESLSAYKIVSDFTPGKKSPVAFFGVLFSPS